MFVSDSKYKDLQKEPGLKCLWSKKGAGSIGSLVAQTKTNPALVISGELSNDSDR